MSEWLPLYAEAIGAPRPRRVPVWLARLVAGKVAGDGRRAAAELRTPRSSASSAGSRAGARWRDGFREAPR